MLALIASLNEGSYALFTPAARPLRASLYIISFCVLLVAPIFHAWVVLRFLPLASLLLPLRCPCAIVVVFSLPALFISPLFHPSAAGSHLVAARKIYSRRPT